MHRQYTAELLYPIH